MPDDFDTDDELSDVIPSRRLSWKGLAGVTLHHAGAWLDALSMELFAAANDDLDWASAGREIESLSGVDDA